MTSGSNNFNSFPENQLPKFRFSGYAKWFLRYTIWYFKVRRLIIMIQFL